MYEKEKKRSTRKVGLKTFTMYRSGTVNSNTVNSKFHLI